MIAMANIFFFFNLHLFKNKIKRVVSLLLFESMSSVPGSSHLWPGSWWSSCGLLEISRRDGKVQKRSDLGSAPAERSAPLFALGAPPCVTREGVAKVIYAGYNVSGWGEFILYISERIYHDIQIKHTINNNNKNLNTFWRLNIHM